MKFTLKYLFIFLLILYIFIVFDFAFTGYPGFIQDSTCFLPAAYFINHFHQLINPLYDAGLDPIQHRFLFYPPLFPYTIAFINTLLPDIYNNVYISQTIIDVASLLVLLWSILIYTKQKKVQFEVYLYAFFILWLAGLFSFYGIQEGRPEVLCKFFISCFLLNNIYKSKQFCNFNNGLIVGLNLITSPVSTFYLIVITLGLMFYNDEFKVKPIVLSLLGFGLIFGCFTIFYPYHLIELFKALQQHSHNVIANRYTTNSLKTFLTFYITYTYAPFLIINFLITIVYAGYQIIRKRSYFALVLLVILTVLVSYFSFKDMPMNYNMLVLSPFFFFVIFACFTQNYLKLNSNLVSRKLLLGCLSFVLLVNSLGFIRKTLLFYNTKNEQFSYADFRKEFNKVLLLTPKNKKVGITFSLWPYCLDQYKRITLNQTDTSIKYLLVQQQYTGAIEPPPLSGFKLINSNFSSKRPKLFGKIPLGNVYPWFQTALYERK